MPEGYDIIEPETTKPAEGFDLVEPERSSPWYRRWLADPALSLAKGVVGLPESLVGLADLATGGLAGKALEAGGYGFQPKATKEFLESFKTPEAQEASQRVAKAKGFFPKLVVAVENPSVIGETALESLPPMLGGAGIARKALQLAPTLSPVVAAAGGEGAITSGQMAEQVRQESDTGLLTPKQVALSVSTGLATGMIGVAGGKLANRLGIADVDTLLARGASEASKKGILRRVVEGAIQEGAFEELPQSAQEQIQQNIAQDKPWDEGVADNAVLGMLTGGFMGALANVVTGKEPPHAKETREQAEARSRAQELEPGEEERLRLRNVEGPGLEAETGAPPEPPQPGTPRRGRIRGLEIGRPGATPQVWDPAEVAAEIGFTVEPPPFGTEGMTPEQIGQMPTGRVRFTDRRLPGESETAGLSFNVPAGSTREQILDAFNAAKAGYTPPVIPPADQGAAPAPTAAQGTPGAPAPVPPVEPTPPAAPPIIPPRVVTISTGKPNGARANVEYDVIEASALKPLIVRVVSEDQTRERKGNRSSDEQINQIAANPDFNFLSANPISLVGAPVVDDVVVAGNARASGLVLAYATNNEGSKRYRQAVLEEAKRLGLDTSGLQNPVLIRRVRQYTKGDRRQFITESNPKYATLPETMAEQALLDAEALGDISKLAFNENGTLAAQGVIEAGRKLAAAQRGVMRTSTGTFNAAELNRRVQMAALAQIAQQNNVPFGDLSGLVESDLGRRYVSELLRFAPRMSKLDADLSAAAPWLEALRKIQQGIRSVLEGAYNNLAEWNAERKNELKVETLSDDADYLIDQLVSAENKPTNLRANFARYLIYAEREQAERNAGATGDLIPEPRKPVTGSQIFQQLRKENAAPGTPGAGFPPAVTPAKPPTPPVIPPTPPSPTHPEVMPHTRKALIDDYGIKQRGSLTKEERASQTALLERLQDEWAAKYRENPTFYNLFPVYLYSRIALAEGKASTYIGYISHANSLLREAPELATLNLAEATDEDMARLWTPLRDDAKIESQGSTFNARKNTFAETLRVTAGMKRIKGFQPNPAIMEQIERLPQGKYSYPGIEAGPRLQSFFDRIRTLVTQAGVVKKNARDAADLAELMAYSGLRISEVLDLQLQDVDFDQNTLRINNPRKQQHGEKPPYDHVMTPAMRNTIQRLIAERRVTKPTDFLAQFMLGSSTADRNGKFNDEYLGPATIKEGGYKHEISSSDFRHFWTSLGKSFGISDLWMAEAHGRRAPKVEGTGAQAEYKHYLGNAKLEADKFKFGTRADTSAAPAANRKGTPVPPPPAAPAAPPAAPPVTGYTVYEKPDPTAPQGKRYVVAAPDEHGIKLTAKQQGWKKVASNLTQEQAFAQQKARNEKVGIVETPPAAAPAEPAAPPLPSAALFKPGDSVTFTPHAKGGRIVSGIVQDVVNGGRGYNIYAPTPDDVHRVVRVWLEDGTLETFKPPPPPSAPPIPPPPSPPEPPKPPTPPPTDLPFAQLGQGLLPGQGMTGPDVLAAVNPDEAAGFPVRVLTKAQAVELARTPNAEGYAGFFHNGVIYLIPENIRNAGEVRKWVRHEAAHGLLRTPEGYKALLEAVADGFQLTPEELQQVLVERKYRVSDEVRREMLQAGMSEEEINQHEQWRALDEFFAIAREGNPTVWQKIKEAIRRFLAKFGLQLTNEETARAILSAVRNANTKATEIEADNLELDPIAFGILEDEPQAEGADETINIAGRTYNILGKDRMTPEQKKAAAQRVVEFFQKLNLPGEPDTTEGKGRGSVDANTIWRSEPLDAFPEGYEAEGEQLINEILTQIRGQDGPGGDPAYVSQLINAVNKNFVLGRWNGVFSESLIDRLMQVTLGESSKRGQNLRAITGIPDDAESIARNLNFYLKRILSDNFGGAEIRKLLERVVVHFRDWITEDELNNLAANPQAAGAKEQLEKLVTKLQGLNRQEEGGRVYRFVQRLFKPKFAKTLARMEKDARITEAVNKVVENLKAQGIKPKPPVGKKNLTAIEALLYMVQPETAVKIDAAIAKAIHEAELNAGKKYALSKVTDPAMRAELEGYYEMGQEPTEEEIEEGLKNPEFSHWRILRDNLTGYNPITIIHAQKVISEQFRGTERDNIYGQKIVRPKDTRIDLNQLAKQPDEEKKRVLENLLFNIEANMQLSEADEETQLRVSTLISEQFQDQLKRAEKRVLDNFLEPQSRMKATTPAERMGNMLNAKLAKDSRFRSAPVVKLLQRVAQRFAKAELFDDVAVMSKEEKADWVQQTGIQIVDEVPELAALDPNDDFRLFAEQVVFNDLATRLQAAESRLVRRILDGKDAKLGTEPVDQEAVVKRLNADRDRLQGAINAGLIDSAMVDSLVLKNVVQRLLPSLNQMITQALNTPFNEQEDIFKNFSEYLTNDLRVDPAVADKARELLKRAYAAKFKAARKLALERALTALSPRELRVVKGRKARWQAIEEAINAGAMNDLPVLEAIAKRNGWMPITPELRQRFQDLVAKMDSYRELNAAERAKVGADPLDVERATRDKVAATEGERVRLKKEIETLWARITRPIDLRTREGRQNLSTAAMEFSAANLLLRAGFPVKQFADIWTQGVLHTPTRALAPVFNRFYDNRRAGLPTHFWEDANVALRNAYKTRLAHWRETLASAHLALKGTQDARNVERLLSGIAAFERMEQYADELAAKGQSAQAVVLRLLTLVRLGYRIASAFDNIHGTPAEWQEIRQQAVEHMREVGVPSNAASLRLDEVLGDAKAEWFNALETAKNYFESSGLTPKAGDLRGAAANITKARAYQKLRELGMPADDFEARGRSLRNTIGWNEREVGGIGGIVANTMLRARQLIQKTPLPFSAVGSIFNFGNAIGTSINRILSFTPLGFNPELFGVERQAIEEGRDAARGSPWYRTRTDRTQRKIEATIGTALGGFALTLAATGIIRALNKWPKDKEERELWERQGHRPGTVEIPVPGGFIAISMNNGVLVPLRPYLAAGGAIYDLQKDRDKAQAKLNADAEKYGTVAGKVAPISFGDMLGVAGEAARSAIVGGRTASGLIGAFTDYGLPNVTKLGANVVAPYIPGLPALQEVSRMAGVRLDAKMASFADFLLPLPTSGAVAVNLLGDKVGTENDLQRVVQVLTGGTYPYVANNDNNDSAAYRMMFETGYRPPSISSTKGYEINGEIRPLTNDELVRYTKLRGQYLKQELSALGPTATKNDGRAAYKSANERALSEIGVNTEKEPVVTTTRTAAVSTPVGAAAQTYGGRPSGGGGRIRSSFGRVRLGRSRRLRTRTSRIRSSFRGRSRGSRRIRQYA